MRESVRLAREAYLAAGADTCWGHFLALQRDGLVAGFGPALVERAALDALCRALGVSFYEAVRRNLIGAETFEGLDLPAFLARLAPAPAISRAARRGARRPDHGR
ncbi:MAG: hypothetical protein RML56_15600 [Burkholderiales bacterium]|nr:hypothetical protein [Burkholderiales bacterium]